MSCDRIDQLAWGTALPSFISTRKCATLAWRYTSSASGLPSSVTLRTAGIAEPHIQRLIAVVGPVGSCGQQSVFEPAAVGGRHVDPTGIGQRQRYRVRARTDIAAGSDTGAGSGASALRFGTIEASSG